MPEKVNFTLSYNVQNFKHIPKKLNWQVMNLLKISLFFNPKQFSFHNEQPDSSKGKGWARERSDQPHSWVRIRSFTTLPSPSPWPFRKPPAWINSLKHSGKEKNMTIMENPVHGSGCFPCCTSSPLRMDREKEVSLTKSASVGSKVPPWLFHFLKLKRDCLIKI